VLEVVGADKLLLKQSELGMGTETPPTAWSQGVIVNLFKAGDTQPLRELQGITPGINLPCKMSTNMLRKRMESQVHLHEACGVQKLKVPQTTCSCSRASSKRLARPTKLSMFFLTRKAYDTVRGMGPPSC
jgi:hypothetical protein